MIFSIMRVDKKKEKERKKKETINLIKNKYKI